MTLPAICTWITDHVAAFRAGPYAPHFIGMVIVAMLGGIWPAVIVVTLSALDMHYFGPVIRPWSAVEAVDVVRPATLLVAAMVISRMMKMRRQTSDELEAALVKLSVQSSVLIEAQQASKCAAWTYDARDRTRWVTGGYEVFGRPFAEIENLPSLLDLIHPEDRERVREAITGMLTERAALLVEYRTLWPNGELHWSEARGNPLPGDPNLWRGVTFDITERKHAEAALIRSEKLAAMGRLASTVAHEVNNPLEAVTNLLFLARGNASLDAETQGYIATAEREVARLGHITRLTLGFVRTTGPREGVDLAAVVDDVISIFQHRLEMKSVRVELHYQRGVLIDIAPHELRQIVVNLLSNAADAVSHAGGEITVRVERQEDSAVLYVQDNGSGISAEHLERVFDPFFSTKQDVGTGIGLWVTRELVEKNGGTVNVDSEPRSDGVRTSFRISFPATAGIAGSAEFNVLDPMPTPPPDAAAVS